MIQVKPIQKVNPLDLTAERKYYAHAVATGTVDLERLAFLIANQSTVREADCYAVTLSLVHNMIDALEQGNIVKLDKLGSFQIGVNSTGVSTEKDLTANVVKKAHVNFRPDAGLRKMLKNLKFKVSS